MLMQRAHAPSTRGAALRALAASAADATLAVRLLSAPKFHQARSPNVLLGLRSSGTRTSRSLCGC